MSASSAHLAEFLKTIYAERLEKEARFGPLLGDEGYKGPSPGNTPTPSISQPTPLPRFERASAADATANQRTPVSAPGGSQTDLSSVSTESGAPLFKSKNRMRITVGALVALIGAAAFFALTPGKAVTPPEPLPAQLTLQIDPSSATFTVDGQPAANPFTHKPGQVRIDISAQGYDPMGLSEFLNPGPATKSITLQRSGPRTHMVKLSAEPADTEVYEGAQLVGKTPALWSDAIEGEHELRLAHAGYREETQKVVVTKDGQEFDFKLRRNEAAKKAAPDLGIKAER
jgi:hypothetical protein